MHADSQTLAHVLSVRPHPQSFRMYIGRYSSGLRPFLLFAAILVTTISLFPQNCSASAIAGAKPEALRTDTVIPEVDELRTNIVHSGQSHAHLPHTPHDPPRSAHTGLSGPSVVASSAAPLEEDDDDDEDESIDAKNSATKTDPHSAAQSPAAAAPVSPPSPPLPPAALSVTPSSSLPATSPSRNGSQSDSIDSLPPSTPTVTADPALPPALLPAVLSEESANGGSLSFIIVIDGGSTGSRVHVHSYRIEQPLPKVNPSKQHKVYPGLSSFASKPSDGGASLIPLLEFAMTKVPRAQWARTPLFLKATAGLRSIPIAEAEAVLEACRRVIQKYPFFFRPEFARIISGAQEGIFAWMAANYLEGFLGNRTAHTVGVIEMGGASMQITFVPDEIPPELLDHTHQLRILDVDYRVYSHSYLNYGLDAAQKLFHATHASEIASAGGHPCFPKDYQGNNITGAGDAEQCAVLMKKLFDRENCSHEAPFCTFNGVVQPPIKKERFYAVENYFYTPRFFGLTEHSDPWTTLERKAQEFCELKWGDMSVTWPKEPKSDLARYCFSSVYLPTILKHGLKLPEPHKNTHVRKDIRGVRIDWALGAVLYELLNPVVPPDPQQTPPDPPVSPSDSPGPSRIAHQQQTDSGEGAIPQPVANSSSGSSSPLPIPRTSGAAGGTLSTPFPTGVSPDSHSAPEEMANPIGVIQTPSQVTEETPQSSAPNSFPPNSAVNVPNPSPSVLANTVDSPPPPRPFDSTVIDRYPVTSGSERTFVDDGVLYGGGYYDSFALEASCSIYVPGFLFILAASLLTAAWVTRRRGASGVASAFGLTPPRNGRSKYVAYSASMV